MTGKLVIDLVPLKPATLNKYIAQERTSRFRAAHLKKKTEAYIQQEVRQAMVNGVSFDWPVKLKRDWYLPDKRIDPGNWTFVTKFLEDAFQKSEVRGTVFLSNDNIEHITGYNDDFYIDKANPRVEIYEDKSYERKLDGC